MQVGLQVRFPLRPSSLLHFLYGTRDVVYNPLQLETIEQNNQILNNLGSLDGKMDSVSSRVDSVASIMFALGPVGLVLPPGSTVEHALDLHPLACSSIRSGQ